MRANRAGKEGSGLGGWVVAASCNWLLCLEKRRYKETQVGTRYSYQMAQAPLQYGNLT